MTSNTSVLSRLFPSGPSFGAAYIAEYAPDSLWYETSLTIAAQAVQEVNTGYHCFDRSPAQVRAGLTKLGVHCTEKEEEGMLNIIDSYTTQLGIGAPEGSKESVVRRSLKISDWSIEFGQDMKDPRSLEDARDHVHIDDNFSVMLRYNDEKSVVDWVRMRGLPQSRRQRELWFIGLPVGIASDSFYKNLELICDGIVDFKSEEREGRLENYLRVRSMRGRDFDSRWHKLEVSNHGEVMFVE